MSSSCALLKADELYVTTDAFQQDLFGRVVFPWFLRNGQWSTFEVEKWEEPTCFHGMCLSQLHTLLEEGLWQCCRWKEETKTSPAAVWVTNTRSSAIDRASAERGHAAKSGYPPDGWDCPVAIGLAVPSERIGKHKHLVNGVRISRILAEPGRHLIPIGELQIVEVNFHRPLYRRPFSTCKYCCY